MGPVGCGWPSFVVSSAGPRKATVWMAQGQIRRFVADRSCRSRSNAERQGLQEIEARVRANVSDVIDTVWMDAAFRAARPRAVAALLRYFGNLDAAEEAFQEACLGALEKWPEKGPPRDPGAWLILVGR